MLKQCNTHKENATIKSGECPTKWNSQLAMRQQKDTEACWTMKHGENHYGYKNHVNVDKTYKLIGQYTVTDVAVHDGQVLKEVLLPAEAGHDVCADSAYRFAEIEAQLRRSGTCAPRFTKMGIGTRP